MVLKRTYRRSSGAKTTRNKRVGNVKVKNLEQMMKKVALKQCETKKSNETNENQQLYHNITRYHGNLFWTTTGSGNPDGFDEDSRNRVGDSILARGCKFRFWLSNKIDRPNVMYRVFIYLYNTEFVSVSDTDFWRGTDGQGATMNRMIDMPNTNRIKLLKSYLVRSKSNFSIPENGHEHSHLLDTYIPLGDRKIKYRVDNEATPQTWDLGFAVVCYDAYGTLITDNIASYAYSTTFYYKDP